MGLKKIKKNLQLPDKFFLTTATLLLPVSNSSKLLSIHTISHLPLLYY